MTDLLGTPGAFEDAMLALVLAADDPRARRAAEGRLADELARASILADVLGRRQLLRELDHRRGGRTRAAGADLPVARLPFQEAIAALLSREPRLQPGVRAAVEAYGSGRTAALVRDAARSADLWLRKRLAALLERGAGVEEAARELRKAAERRELEWPLAYARNVFRTNVATAFTAGKLQQAQEPAVRREFPGWRFEAVGDADTRENHLAADGFVAHQDDPAWRTLAPPLGHNCRCSILLSDQAETRAAGAVDRAGRMVLQPLPEGAGPDEGFQKGLRTDAGVYGR